MNHRVARQLITLGTLLTAWSAITLAAILGGHALGLVTR